MNRLGVLVFVGMLLGSVSGCQTAGSGMPGGGQGGGDGPGQGSDGGGNGAGSVYTLTLTLESLEEGSTLKRVWVTVDDQAYTRETFPYGMAGTMNILALEETHQVTVTAQPGQWVSLVAFDPVESFSAGVSRFTEIDNISSPDANEFVRWDGDFETANITDFGELSYQADRDRSITAVYQRMPTFIVRSLVNGELVHGPGILATLEVSDFLSFPEDSGPKTLEYGFSQGYMGVQQIGVARSGSVLTLEPNPEQSADYIFQGWSGTCDGGTCVLDVDPPEADVTSIWTLP